MNSVRNESTFTLNKGDISIRVTQGTFLSVLDSGRANSLTGLGRRAILQGCEIGGSPPRYWTGGRAVECTSLENWRTRKGIESSNLSLSAFSSRRHVWTAASFFS